MAEKAATFWRRLDWRMWRHSYISRTPEAERLAWIHSIRKPDATSPEEDRCLVQVRDISLGGIILLCGRRFESGTLLKIDVQNSLGRVPLTLLARVIQVTRQPEGSWVVSCCFAKELGDDELRAFGAERKQTGPADIRAWVRFPCDVETRFHSVLAAQPEKLTTRILNVSPGGVALLVPKKYETGTLLSIELSGIGVKSMRKIKARVIHVAEKDGQYVLGCTFVGELSDEELHLLE